jgi:hypothetical protein
LIYTLTARWHVPQTEYELQRIDGEDGSVWIRVSRDANLVAVFSTARAGRGAVPVGRVVAVLAEASTARRPEVLINALRFHGWDFWPAVPLPLGDYLDNDFRLQIGRVDVTEPAATVTPEDQ